MKLTKAQAKAHAEAEALIDADRPLTEDEKVFVLDHWQAAGTTTHVLDGAFFTPRGLARDFSLEIHGDRVIDLCAGIGALSHGCRDLLRKWTGQPEREFVCVEKNPAYVRVGKRILPEATWITGDVLDIPAMGLGRFDTAISNPPFGATKRTGNGPKYRGRRFEYHVIDVASTLADHGVFIIPQTSASFRYSGQPRFATETDAECARFTKQTGIRMEPNCGIDTSYHKDDWQGVSPAVEIVVCDFAQEGAEQQDEAPEKASAVRAVVDIPQPSQPVQVEHVAGQLDLTDLLAEVNG